MQLKSEMEVKLTVAKWKELVSKGRDREEAPGYYGGIDRRAAGLEKGPDRKAARSMAA